MVCYYSGHLVSDAAGARVLHAGLDQGSWAGDGGCNCAGEASCITSFGQFWTVLDRN